MYQILLQVAAGTRRPDETAALNITYTASVAAVDAMTPSANHGSICHTVVYLGAKFIVQSAAQDRFVTAYSSQSNNL